MPEKVPDNQQHLITEHFAMAHARLSIIDLSAASNQPFVSSDGRFTLVYNGEIFNYKDLRQDLKGKGYVFYSEGDVEVLLNLYKEFGKSFLHKLNGFFAFVPIFVIQIECKIFILGAVIRVDDISVYLFFELFINEEFIFIRVDCIFSVVLLFFFTAVKEIFFQIHGDSI